MSTKPVSDAVAQVVSRVRGRFPAGAIVTESAEVLAAARVWNAQVLSYPAMLIRCRRTAEVQAVVRAAREAGLPLSVRGGGHDWAGRAVREGALVIDLSGMHKVEVVGDAVIDDVARRPLVDVVRAAGEPFPDGGNYRLGSRIVPALPELNDTFMDAFLQCAEAMPQACALNVHHAHGAATRVPIEATSHAYRDEHMVVQILGKWRDGDGSVERAWVHNTERAFDVVSLPGGWTNLMAPGDPRARDAYGVNTARLLAAKAQYDPDGILQAIPLPA